MHFYFISSAQCVLMIQTAHFTSVSTFSRGRQGRGQGRRQGRGLGVYPLPLTLTHDQIIYFASASWLCNDVHSPKRGYIFTYVGIQVLRSMQKPQRITKRKPQDRSTTKRLRLAFSYRAVKIEKAYQNTSHNHNRKHDAGAPSLGSHVHTLRGYV